MARSCGTKGLQDLQNGLAVNVCSTFSMKVSCKPLRVRYSLAQRIPQCFCYGVLRRHSNKPSRVRGIFPKVCAWQEDRRRSLWAGAFGNRLPDQADSCGENCGCSFRERWRKGRREPKATCYGWAGDRDVAACKCSRDSWNNSTARMFLLRWVLLHGVWSLQAQSNAAFASCENHKRRWAGWSGCTNASKHFACPWDRTGSSGNLVWTEHDVACSLFCYSRGGRSR